MSGPSRATGRSSSRPTSPTSSIPGIPTSSIPDSASRSLRVDAGPSTGGGLGRRSRGDGGPIGCAGDRVREDVVDPNGEPNLHPIRADELDLDSLDVAAQVTVLDEGAPQLVRSARVELELAGGSKRALVEGRRCEVVRHVDRHAARLALAEEQQR